MLVAYKFCIFLFFISWAMHIQNLGLFCNLVFVKWKGHSRNQNMSNTIIMLSLSAMTNACLLQKHNAMQWRMTEWVVYTRINAYTFTRDYTGIGCVCSKVRAVSKGKEMTADKCHGNVFTWRLPGSMMYCCWRRKKSSD